MPDTDVDLVVGLVGPVGSDLPEVARLIAAELAGVRYAHHTLRVSDLLHDIPRWAGLAHVENEYERIRHHIRVLRRRRRHGDP